MSVLLIPAISTCLGYFIGKGLSNNIDEYKTLTKYNNYTTGKLVSEEEFYDEKSTTSVSSIEIDYPWQEIYNGAKYTRQIEVYDYDDNISKEKLSLDEIIANFKLKYVYTEQKNELSNDDYTDKTVIYVVNTSQDKNDTRKSTKFVIPLSITGGGLGIAIDVILMITGLYDYDYNYLNQKRRKYYQSLIIEKEKIKSNNELIKIADKIVVLKENENTISKGKQNIDDVLSPLVRKR